MSEPLATAPEALAFGPAGRVLRWLCRVFAMAGALVFVAIVLMSVVSLTGRKLWSSPIAGDVEMLQMCAAFAAASFFAWCHLSGSDVKVDFFTARMSPRAVHVMDAFGSLLVAFFGAVVAWRTAQGAWMVKEAGEQSMLLDWPLWIPQMAMVPGFALLAWAASYRALQHLGAAAQPDVQAHDRAGEAA
ncbi:TRAP transporter small permease (plasmid) [Acidovorax sp. DW039]|uniref:TRAP transporter small permease n=1 Tax=Acidovorax sp. DW039 TaxID=3095606 RepID=UPI00308B00FB|nr:TRAP transporter small permease [Acidovorax sp. DW039]